MRQAIKKGRLAMLKVLLIDSDVLFTDDVQQGAILGSYDNLSLIIRNDPDNLMSLIEREKPDRIVIHQSMLDAYDWHLPIPIRSYARTDRQLRRALNEKYEKIPCYGVVHQVSGLLSAIQNDSVMTLKKSEKKEADDSKQQDAAKPSDHSKQTNTQKKKQKKERPPMKKKKDEFEFEEDDKKHVSKNRRKYEEYEEDDFEEDEFEDSDLYEDEETEEPEDDFEEESDDEYDHSYPDDTYEEDEYADEYPEDEFEDPDDEYEDNEPNDDSDDADAYEDEFEDDEYEEDEDDSFDDEYADDDYEDDYEEEEKLVRRKRPVRRVEQEQDRPLRKPVRPRREPEEESRPVRREPRPERTRRSQDAGRRDSGKTERRPKPVQRPDERKPAAKRCQQTPERAEATRRREPERPRTNTRPARQAENLSRPRAAAMQDRMEEARTRKETRTRNEREKEARRKQEQIEQEIEHDLGTERKDAKVITVYSAKGGVGKTTIACELAVYLSLVEHGKDHFKVCLADYNIDFGDVRMTLGFDSNHICMTQWAADIRERLKTGMSPQKIRYSEDEIHAYLQEGKNGLYALIAPMSNEDSMELDEDELDVMLSNLIKYGGFDFVICDTGNNTRDSSFLAVEKADSVLLISDQDKNAIDCNDSVLLTMSKIGVDLDKFKLVINKAQKGKDVGIYAEEIAEVMQNPQTEKQLGCIAIIRDSNAVRRANNTGEPLVYDSGDKFTASIGKIASYEIDEDFVLEEPEKKGFFARMFHRK